jgi:NTE family protein
METSESLNLALGGGGVKCYAHIGVLQALQELNISVSGIAATSAGALIAALFATGHTPTQIQQIASTLDFRKLSRIHKSDRRSLWGLTDWKRAFNELFGDQTFESLPIPIAFPLVDLGKNEEIVIKSGRIVDALLAAVAIPGIFPPQYLNGRTVIDGGALNPIPTQQARSLSPFNKTAAVALVPPVEKWHEHPFPRLINSVPLLKILGKLRYTQALGVYIRSSDLTNRLLAEYRLKDENPDYVIRPDVNHLGLFDHMNANEIIEAGKTAAIDELKERYA